MPSFKSFKRSRRDEGSDGEGSAVEPAKKAKTGTATVSAAEKDAEGNSFWPVRCRAWGVTLGLPVLILTGFRSAHLDASS